jgi:hypothetical protein
VQSEKREKVDVSERNKFRTRIVPVESFKLDIGSQAASSLQQYRILISVSSSKNKSYPPIRTSVHLKYNYNRKGSN